MTFHNLKNNSQKTYTDTRPAASSSNELNAGSRYPVNESETARRQILSLNIKSNSGCFVISPHDHSARESMHLPAQERSDAGPITGGSGIVNPISPTSGEEDEHSFLMSLINTIPFGMHIVDMEGTILYHSEKMKELAGEDCTGKKCWEICSDNKKQNSDCPLLRKSSKDDTGVYEARNLFGGRIFSISYSKMLFRGKPAMLEIFQDITDKKVTEDELRRSESHYRSLVELSPDAILIVDFEGYVRYASQKVYPLLRIPESYNLTGASILDWISPDHHLKVMERINDLLTENKSPGNNEYRLLRYDGSPFWAEVSSAVLPPVDGKENGLLVICRDISERKKTAAELIRTKEKAEEGDRLKTAFLKNISHEIRTPLNAIVGFSTLLDDPDMDRETIKNYTDIIIQSSNNLILVVENIIEMANIEIGIIKGRLIPCDIIGLMEKLFSESRFKFLARGLDFTYTSLLAGGQSMVMTDVAKVEFILSAFLSNALKFTEKGSVGMECRKSGNTIEFIVADTGTGIRPEDEDRIFEKFYQTDYSLSRLREGTGLGLPISKAYAGIINGSVRVKSEYGRGSAFCLTIPFIPALPKYGLHEEGHMIQTETKPAGIYTATV